MITKMFDKDGMTYIVGERGITRIDDFSEAVGYPNFVVYFTGGKRQIIYNPNMTVEIEPKKEE